MHLIESKPSGYGAHNTGGEHAHKHFDDPLYVEVLRQKYITPAPDPWDIDDVRDLMRNDTSRGQLVSVSYFPEDSRAPIPVVAGSLMHYELDEAKPYAKVARVSDLVVAPEHRKRQLASFMLGIIWQRLPWGRSGLIYPSQMIIDGQHDRPEWFDEALETAGFNTITSKEPSLELPGQWFEGQVNREEYAKLVNHMPDGWNGVIPAASDEVENGGLMTFRDGVYVGNVRPLGEISYDKHDVFTSKHGLYDVNGDLIKTGWYQSDRFAVVDLINHLRAS